MGFLGSARATTVWAFAKSMGNESHPQIRDTYASLNKLKIGGLIKVLQSNPVQCAKKIKLILAFRERNIEKDAGEWSNCFESCLVGVAFLSLELIKLSGEKLSDEGRNSCKSVCHFRTRNKVRTDLSSFGSNLACACLIPIG